MTRNPLPRPVPPRPHTHTARLVQWDQKKGFGFLQHGKRRLFLHWRDFAVKHRKPEVGDEIRFQIGKDGQGRRCAREAVQVDPSTRLSPAAAAGLLALLVLPALAARALGMNLLWAGTYLTVMSYISYRFYQRDKDLARDEAWRTPEAQLQALDILGGWPGGFLAQRRLRHKCAKGIYQFMFWLVVGVWQYLSLEVLLDWRVTRFLFAWL